MFTKRTLLGLSLSLLFLTACGGGSSSEKAGDSKGKTETKKQDKAEKEGPSADPMKSKGVGPVDNVELGEKIDEQMAKEGKKIYEDKCTACHKATKEHIGPAPQGILERRSPEWIMNMILNPEEMVQKDPTAKELLAEYNGSPMANQNLSREQARKILEYFRTL